MSDEQKKLEAIGDGLLLACARLYLKERHPSVRYAYWTRLIQVLINNRTLARIAEGEGITGDKPADAFEREIARRFYSEGFAGVRAWLWSLFDRHVDIAEEIRKIEDPQAADALFRVVHGGLRNVLKTSGGVITERSAQSAARQIVDRLMKQAE